MAIKKKSTKKKRTPKKKEVKTDGIHLERSKSRTQKGQYFLTVWNNGREILRTSENYHNLKDLLDATESAARTLTEYFVMNNNANFHDNTGGK